MAVSISTARLAQMVNDGVENNPVVGIDDVLRAPGEFTSGEPFGAARVADGATYTFWAGEGTGPGGRIIVYEMESAQTVDMMGVAAHNVGALGRTISAQYWDGSSWSNLAPSSGANETIVWIGDEVETDRVRFVVSDSGDDAAIGVAFAGRSYTFDQRFYQDYDEARYPTNVELLKNPSGPHVLGTSVIGKGSQVEWSLQHLREDTLYNNSFAAFVDAYNKGMGFFSAWRPADYGTAYYGHRQGGTIQLPNSGPQRRKSLTFGMQVYDDY